MKKFLLISAILFLIFAVKNNYSQLLLEENFNYPAGDSLGAHGWVTFSGTTNILKVVSPGLTYTGYPSSGIGNAARVTNNGYDAYKQFTPDSTGSMYISFMVKVDSALTGDYFLAMLPVTNTSYYTARVYAKDSASGLSFGISKSASSQGPIAWSPNTYVKGTTYLLVVKYKFLSGTTDDEASMFIFTSPTLPATEPPTPTIGPVTSTSNDNSIGRVALRQGSSSSSPSLTIDGIRVSKAWNYVVAVQNTSSEVPASFGLKQNYPNPFNPSTTIEFNVKTNSFVTLNVFDILGRNVSSLVNEKLSAGSYRVNFNASLLSSGVYYYRLNAIDDMGSSFVDTKSMILVK